MCVFDICVLLIRVRVMCDVQSKWAYTPRPVPHKTRREQRNVRVVEKGEGEEQGNKYELLKNKTRPTFRI